MPDPSRRQQARNQRRDSSGRFASSGGSGGTVDVDNLSAFQNQRGGVILNPFAQPGEKIGKKLNQSALAREAAAAHYPSKADFDAAHAAATRSRSRRRSNPADNALRKIILVPHDQKPGPKQRQFAESIEEREQADQEAHEILWGKKRRR